MNPFDIVKGGLLKVAVGPGDLNAAAIDGPYQDLRDFDSVGVYIAAAAGSSGGAPTLVLKQATDSAGSGEKALGIEKLYYKVGAGEWTLLAGIDRESPVASVDMTTITGADTSALEVLIHVHQGSLDTNNGFSHIKIDSAANPSARDGVVCYVSNDSQERG